MQPNATVPASVIQSESTVDALREQISKEPGTLFAVLDACDEPRVPEQVSQWGAEHAVSLYRGWAEDDYWGIAPYLAQLDEPMLDWIVENLWNDPWGIFAVAPPDLAALRKHFRRFLKVLGPDGKELYFRFYDPRVLPVFVTTGDRQEMRTFFGPVRSFFIANDGGSLNRFAFVQE
jgi:hypothetical protein